MSAKDPPDPPFPTGARVAYRIYRIEVWPPRSAMGAGRYGEADHVGRTIRVDIQHGPRETANTLLHELLHAVMDLAGHDKLDGPPEEFVVASLASFLTQLMVDSPEVRDWLAWAWAQES